MFCRKWIHFAPLGSISYKHVISPVPQDFILPFPRWGAALHCLLQSIAGEIMAAGISLFFVFFLCRWIFSPYQFCTNRLCFGPGEKWKLFPDCVSAFTLQSILFRDQKIPKCLSGVLKFCLNKTKRSEPGYMYLIFELNSGIVNSLLWLEITTSQEVGVIS